MGSAPSVGRAFFPLDRELALPPGKLTPHAYESLVGLATWMPFERARTELERLLRVTVSEPTVRRYAEAAGKNQVAVQMREVERIERTLPEAPAGPAKQLLSVDGAMAPLVGGEWAEVKTLVIGEIQPAVQEGGEAVVHTEKLSYFSRLAEATQFGRQALVETHHRGVEKAEVVAAVTDGAEWEQGFIDYHRPDAIRILDFAHASEHLSQIGQAVWGAETPQTKQWLSDQLHTLHQAGSEQVLVELRRLRDQHPAQPEVVTHLAYLEKRAAHMRYPEYIAQGLPIGSGAVESANKLVVEARLKGSGMHWARHHVNPMLALRNVACNDRWQEAWPQIIDHHRQQALLRQRQRRDQRLASLATLPPLPPIPTPVPPPAQPLTPEPPALQPSPLPPTSPTTHQSHHRPAPNHPWRRMPVGKARYQPPSPSVRKN